MINIKYVNDVEVFEMVLMNGNSIIIEIEPKSAWGYNITIKLIEDKVILDISNGGWNKPENALDETFEILKGIKNIEKELINQTKEVNNLINEYYKTKEEIDKIKKEIKKEEYEMLIKNGELKKLDVNKLDKSKEYKIYVFENWEIKEYNLLYNKSSRRWVFDGHNVTKSYLKGLNLYYKTV